MYLFTYVCVCMYNIYACIYFSCYKLLDFARVYIHIYESMDLSLSLAVLGLSGILAWKDVPFSVPIGPWASTGEAKIKGFWVGPQGLVPGT